MSTTFVQDYRWSLLCDYLTFPLNIGSYTCTCFSGYTGNGKTCFPVPDKPVQLTVTEIKPSEVTVAWSVANTTIIRNFTVEYKGLGIHGREWAVIVLQPHETQTHLKDLESDSTYLVRIGKSRDYRF